MHLEESVAIDILKKSGKLVASPVLSKSARPDLPSFLEGRSCEFPMSFDDCEVL